MAYYSVLYIDPLSIISILFFIFAVISFVYSKPAVRNQTALCQHLVREQVQETNRYRETKQTTEEVQRLEKIKKELQTLDNSLSLDVCILRKQIDPASLSFAEAEKHYNKAESEFLAAKISMHKEREKKEQLMEHLCAIIAHNKARKAKKLEDLMEKLNDGIGKRTVVDGVCEQTGKMLELDENGEVIKDDDDD